MTAPASALTPTNVIPLPARKAPAPPPKPARTVQRIKLTEGKVRAMPIPATGERTVWDTQVPALGLRLRAGRETAFIVQRWNADLRRSEKVTLGKVGTVSLDWARGQAQALVQEATGEAGATLSLAGAKVKGRSLSLADGFERYMADRPAMRTAATHRNTWKNWIEPSGLAAIPMSAITTDLLDDKVFAPIRKAGFEHQADRVRAILSSIWRWHLAREAVSKNPVAAIRLRRSGEHRARYLTQAELARFKAALDHEDAFWRDLFLVLLGTSARKGNVIAMCWTDLDLAERRWTIPGAVSKNGRPVQVRLSEEVAVILLRRQAETQGREWVFPSPKDPTAHVADPKRAWERVIAAASLTDVRMHDLRRTGGAFAALAGASGAQIAAVLGHRDLRSAKHYVDLRGDAGELVDVLGRLLLGDGKGGAA